MTSRSSGSLEIIPWSKACETQISDFVAQHSQGLIYYGPAFRRYLTTMLHANCRSRLAVEDGRLTGILPVLAVDGPYGTVLNSLPFFGSYGGLLSITDAAEVALLSEYEKLASASDVALSVWVSHPFTAVRPPRHDYQDERIAQWTDLTAMGCEGLPRNIDSTARRNVQKAESLGVVVRESPDALGFLAEVHAENMATIGGLAKPQEFFRYLPETMTYGDDWRLYIAERNKELLAALLIFRAGHTVEYVMPAVRNHARSLQPSAAILARAMSDARKEGFTRWNWGGTWLTQEGVHRFKRKWGAAESRYRYFITLNNQSLLTLTAKKLAHAYPWFYTVPYHLLSKGAAT